MTRVAIYGGGFDPPHRAHVAAAREVLQRGAAGRVLVFPAARHAFGKELSDFTGRLRMCRLAFAPLGDRCEVRDDEHILVRAGGDGTTIELIRHLRATGRDDLALLIGTDQLPELHRWREVDALFDLAAPILLARPGYEGARAAPRLQALMPQPLCKLADIRSTAIRERLRRTGDPGPDVPEAVAAYLRALQASV